MATDSLKMKAVSGVLWTAIQKYTMMGVQFISGIILARLLTPEDYGCVGMLSIFIVVSNVIVDGGFGSALIQKQRPLQEDFSTIFYWNMGMALLMYLILYFCAPLVASFYRMPILCIVLRVQGISLFFTSLSSVQFTQLRKIFEFKKIATVTLIAGIASIITTIVLAYKEFGVWALVFGNLVTGILTSTMLWLSCKWKPLLVFSKKSFKELFSFGFYMFASNIVNNICNNIQGILIGRIYTASDMGYYSKAHGTESMASTSISQIMGQVTYPLYAEFQNCPIVLANIIKKLTAILAFLTFPLMLLLLIEAKPIFIILYSDRWLPSVPYFQLLCFAGMGVCLQSVNSQAIAAIGKSKTMLRSTLIMRTLGLLFITIGMLCFGMFGLLAGMVLNAWFFFLVNASLVSKYIGYKLDKQLINLLPIFGIAFFSLISAYGIGYVFNASLYIDGLIKLVTFVAVYLLTSTILHLDALSYTRELLPILINKIIRKK